MAASAERNHVEAIASDGLARKSGACYGDIRQVRQRFRQELVLDPAGDLDFVVEPRFGASRREQPRVLDKMGRFEYVNAGHVPPLIRKLTGLVEALGSANFPVGMFAEAEYQSARVNLDPGDFLVIYSDGVSEASNMNHDLFEESRLRHILETFPGQTVEELAQAIRDGLKAFTQGAPQSDDITILAIQYKGNAA